MRRPGPSTPVRRFLRGFAALAAALLLALPDAAWASPAMDQMSPEELERFVEQLNYEGNWRKYRRPSDPPDFVPGKPIRVMHGAGSAFGGGGAGRFQNFRRSGLASRRSGPSARTSRRQESSLSSRNTSSSSSSSSRSRSSFGSTFGNSGTALQSGFDQ